MVNPDLLNGILEFIGSLTIWANVRKLRQDKIVKGTHWEMMFFFASWATFNLFYYPHLNQMWSLAGATSMFVAEWVWVILACYYAKVKYWAGTEVEGYNEIVLPERDRSLNNIYSPESILFLQRKYGGENVQVQKRK